MSSSRIGGPTTVENCTVRCLYISILAARIRIDYVLIYFRANKSLPRRRYTEVMKTSCFWPSASLLFLSNWTTEETVSSQISSINFYRDTHRDNMTTMRYFHTRFFFSRDKNEITSRIIQNNCDECNITFKDTIW